MDCSRGAYTVLVVGGSVFTTPVGGVTYYCSNEFELQVDLGTWA